MVVHFSRVLRDASPPARNVKVICGEGQSRVRARVRQTASCMHRGDCFCELYLRADSCNSNPTRATIPRLLRRQSGPFRMRSPWFKTEAHVSTKRRD